MAALSEIIGCKNGALSRFIGQLGFKAIWSAKTNLFFQTIIGNTIALPQAKYEIKIKLEYPGIHFKAQEFTSYNTTQFVSIKALKKFQRDPVYGL